jgi:predicted RNA binding protein YcfA (HicA-like mRNA interferase family)
MSKHGKVLQRLLEKPAPVDIRWSDLKGALEHLGYHMLNNSGSRRKFVHPGTKHVISVHEPHPQPVVKAYVIRDVVGALREAGAIKEEDDGNA